jgi:acyl-CoA carboxylase epsilon subunit
MSSVSESISRVWDACHRNRPATSYARSMDKEPLVRVVRGTPTELELAALVAVVAAGSTSVDAKPARPATSAWTRAARPSMGPTSWRHSALP